ncbi:MoaD/ThiS family protein [Halanaerobiaceae bacterium Z-7014]|uniref:MoaD/ThiS family protein n=1 Tax=Halonatronomonas betaini TaxID=2778430 RepID=A0A931F6N6_9FIRM|nr:MoaD/ThiS family protein [Halonatronomonas betaini]MBF8437125.1 MoaD/ThiS family protein [Halonatronomonas betaini]
MGTEKKLEVVVKIVGHLEKYISGDQNELNLKLNAGSRIIDIFQKLEFPEKEIKYIMILVNGQPASKETALKSGDRISLLTLADGG